MQANKQLELVGPARASRPRSPRCRAFQAQSHSVQNRRLRHHCCLASRQQQLQDTCEAQRRCQHGWTPALASLVAAFAVGLSCPSSAALAAVQTVAPQDATSYARPLPQQSVNKGKVWLIFLAGATGLFGAAVAIEKNSKLFPAIAKANQAMAATKAAQKKKQEEDQKWEDVRATEARTEDAVLQGFEDARSRAQETKPQQPLSGDSHSGEKESESDHANGSQSQSTAQEGQREKAVDSR